MSLTDPSLDAAEMEVHRRIGWVIRLRWIAVAGLFTVILAADFGLGLFSYPLPLYILGSAMLLYNTAFQSLYWRLKTMSPQGARLFAVSQITLDLVMLALLVHFSGGMENPFIFFFVIPVILSSILLPRGAGYAVAGLACVLVGLMALLEDAGILAHYNLQGFLPDYVWENPLYALGVGLVFVATLFAAAYLSSSAMAALRKRERDLHDIRMRLAPQEALAALGRLAAGIAHEIGNPLASISALSELTISESKDERTIEALKAIKEQIARVSNIIQQVMDFARPASSEWQKVVIHQVIESALDVLRYDPRLKKIQVIKEFSAAVPASCVMSQQMAQVFTNIFLNALDAMEGKNGRLTVRTGVAGDQITIIIEDTGPGMTPEALAHVFEPFFTTKPRDKGTGLGLAVSLDIVQRHGGTITVESEPGKGSRFTIRLPIKTSLA